MLYRVDTPNRKYILRIGNPGDHSREEVLSQLRWLYGASQIGKLPTPVPVRNCAGKLLTMVEHSGLDEPRQCTLFEWILGVELEEQLNLKTAYQWGLRWRRSTTSQKATRPDYPELRQAFVGLQ